ncbi:MAG: TonB-dependent receptor [Bacteroidia bacterium]|nr:TonB-dependent receptor [Bacteroidia bacterium]
MRRYLIALFTILSLNAILGQQVKTDSITRLPGITLTEPAKSRELGITTSSVLRESALEQFGPIDFASTLNQTSGVFLLSGALNTNRITIRGVGARTPFGTDKLRLYYKNIPVTNGTGVSTLEAFDLEDLYAIEIVKGPKASAYGSALGGAILLKPEVPSGKTLLKNSLNLGSYQLIKDHLSFTTSESNFSMRVNANLMRTDGYRENNDFERNGFLADATIGINSKHSLSLLLNYMDYNAQIPSSLNETDFNSAPTKAAFTWSEARGFEDNQYTLTGLNWKYDISSALSSEQSVFYTYLDHYEARPFNILDEFTNSFGWRGLLTHKSATNKAIYRVGMELFKDEYNWATYENLYEDNNGLGSLQGSRLSSNKEFRSQYFLFGQAQFPVSSSFTMQFNLNLNRTTYDFRDLFNSGSDNTSAKKKFDWIFMPGIDLSYTLSKGKRIYANISRGFSNPGLEETLTPDGLINPDLEQEKGWQYEVGTQLNFPESGWNVQLSIYRMRIKDLLVSDRIGEDQFIGRNAGSTIHNGLELDLQKTFKVSQGSLLIPYISYTLNDHEFQEFIDEDEDYSGNPLTGVPKQRANMGVRAILGPNWQWNIGLQYVDEIPLTDANTLNSNDYFLWHANLAYSHQLLDRLKLQVKMGVNNLFNERYAQSVLINASSFGGSLPRYYYPGNDRNFYAGLHLEWAL